MADVEKSFQFLQDDIPSWRKTLTELAEKFAQEELVKAPLPTPSPLKRRKTQSTKSIRDTDRVFPNRSGSLVASQPKIDTLKRKSASSLSGDYASTPRCRARAAMVAVHYDGQIQKQFEALVRSIGAGRNMLRKGKMAARASALAELVSSSDDDSDDGDAIRAKFQSHRRTGLLSTRVPARGIRGPAPNSTAIPEALFDSLDKTLEQAQSLCEKAAHQTLREGDCRKELDGMRKFFDEVFETATQEVTKHNARKEQEQAKDTEEDTDLRASKSLPKPVPLPTVLAGRLTSELKQPVPRVRPLPSVPIMPKNMDIEVDDDDDDDIAFVMPPVRLMSRV